MHLAKNDPFFCKTHKSVKLTYSMRIRHADKPTANNRTRQNLTSEQRIGVVRYLLLDSKEGPQNFVLRRVFLLKCDSLIGVIHKITQRCLVFGKGHAGD
jgi:hypothetical protein